MAEIVRAGIQSVDAGQTEAAAALGMSRGQMLRRIVLPQAMRVIVPPTGNETIAMLKDTSLVAFVPVTTELFFQLKAIGSRTFQVFPMLVAAVPLVPGADQRPDGRAVLPGAALLQGVGRSARARPGCAPSRRRPAAAAPAGRGTHDRPVDPGAAAGTGRRRRRDGRAQDVHKSFGSLEVLKGIDLEVRSGEVVLRARPVRLGQVDVPALHQPPGEDQRRPDLGRRRADRLPRARRQAARAARHARSPRSAGPSAWSSSGSICSRT